MNSKKEASIRYVSQRDELDFFVDENWAVVTVTFTSPGQKRDAVSWIEDFGVGRVVIYNGGVRPQAGEIFWADALMGDEFTYYFFFEDKKIASMFKCAKS